MKKFCSNTGKNKSSSICASLWKCVSLWKWMALCRWKTSCTPAVLPALPTLLKGTALTCVMMVPFIQPAVSQPIPSELQRAYEKIASEEYLRAIELLEPFISESYPPEGAFRLLSSAYLLSEQPGYAYRTASEGLDLYPGSAKLHVIAIDALRHENPDDALEKLDELISDFDQGKLQSEQLGSSELRYIKSRIHVMGGQAAMASSDYDTAVSHFESAAALERDDLSNYHHILYAYLRSGNYDKVLDVYDGLSPEKQSDRTMTTLRSQALLELDEIGELSEIYKGLYEENPDDLEQALVYGRLLLADNKILKANEVFNTLLETFPEDRRVYDVLIEVNQQQMNYHGLAVLYEQMIHEFPDDKELPLKLAELHQIRGEFDQADAVYDSLIRHRGMEYRFVRKQAALYFQQEETEKAYEKIKYGGEYIRAGPENADDIYGNDGIGEEPPEKEKGYKQDADGALQAADYVSDAAWPPEQDTEWFFDIGMLAFLLNKYEDSAGYFSTYTTHAPEDSLGWMMLGRSYDRLGDKENARKAYIKAHTKQAFWPEAFLLIVDADDVVPEDTLYYALDKAVSDIEERRQLLGLKAQFAMRGQIHDTGTQPFYPGENQLRDLMQSLEKLNTFVIETIPAGKVRQMYQRLLQEHSDNADAYKLAADYFSGAGDRDQALSLYKSAADLSPNEYTLHISIAEIKEEKEEIDRAVLWYERALGAEATSEVYRSLIRLHRQNGTLDHLVDRWLIRYQARSVDPEFREYLIDALHRAGRRVEAREIAQDR